MSNNDPKLSVTHAGVLPLGDYNLECVVRADGQRLVSFAPVRALLGLGEHREIARLIPKKTRKTGVPETVSNSPETASKAAESKDVFGVPGLHLAPYLHDKARKVVQGLTPEGLIALFKNYGDQYIDGTLPKSREQAGRAAIKVINSLAGVGLVALIDEVTGFQAARSADDLQKRFQLYLRAELADWSKMFPDSLAAAICVLYGKPIVKANGGRWLANVWHRIHVLLLGLDIKTEIKRRNPDPRHNSNHTQLLTDPANGLFADDLRIVEAIARISQGADDFWARLNAHFRGDALQLRLVG